MPKPHLSQMERDARLRNYLRRFPNDPLLKYVVTHHEVIGRILAKTGSLDLVLSTVSENRIVDMNGDLVTYKALRHTWDRVVAVLDRAEKFDENKDKPTRSAAKATPAPGKVSPAAARTSAAKSPASTPSDKPTN